MKELHRLIAPGGKRKRCRHCHSTTNAEAPCCDACGFDFTATPLERRFQASSNRRIIAAGTGLLGAATVWFLRT